MMAHSLSLVDEAPDPPGEAEDGTPELTIEQLAAQTGLTVRNIRSHRARGLLPAPMVRERVGYYGGNHIARLELVRELQAQGFNLAAIKQLIERSPGDPDQLLSAIHVVQEPFESEQPQIVTAEELASRFSVDDPEPVLKKASELGVLVFLGEGRFEAPAPSLLDVAEDLVSRGVPIHHSLAVVAKVRDNCREIAHEFVRLFLDDVFRPFQADGMPAERWPEIVEAIEKLRPISAQVVLAMYQLSMTAEVESGATKEFERLIKGRG